MRWEWNVREWLPNQRETLVVPLAADALLARLRTAVSFTLPRDPLDEPFWGWIKSNRFRISLKVKRPTPYMPVIVGSVEATRTGSILFLRYQLLPTTKVFLLFWTLLICLGSVFVAFQYQRGVYAAAGALILVFIHAVVWANFHLQRKIAREQLLALLARN